MREKLKEGIIDTDKIISKIDAFGAGMRNARQTVANTFRTFADKEVVDYADKERKFSKTEMLKNHGSGRRRSMKVWIDIWRLLLET